MPQRRHRLIAFTAALATAPGYGEAGPAPTALILPDSPTAIAMTRPSLPAFVAGDCPGPDPCEFGTTWDVCEPVPVLREPRDGAPLLRRLKANDSFIAESGRIELVAPGKIRVNETTEPVQTGGIALAKGTLVETYAPLQSSRALYYDPNSGKGWTPPAANDDVWLWDGKIAKLVEAPRMTWWVEVRLKDRQTGWLQLKSTGTTDNFPVYDSAAVVRSWDINRTRDDETPDCGGLLSMLADEKAR